MHKVSLMMGSANDFPILKSAVTTLKSFNVEVEVRVLSAHRTPDEAAEFVKGADARGVKVIIAAAGKAAHLAGAVAANTVLPVIGIPLKADTLDGMDALLATVQMPSGVPVATVAINGATNAALLAVQILATSDEMLKQKLIDYKMNMKKAILDAEEKISKELLSL